MDAERRCAIGGKFKPGSITRQHLEALAGQLSMRPQFFLRQAAEFAEKVPAALHRALDETSPPMSRPAKALASKLAGARIAERSPHREAFNTMLSMPFGAAS